MYYICKKKDGLYGVIDTDDGVIEYFEPKDIIRIVAMFHFDIKGVKKNANGKWSIKVLKPTEFKEIESSDYSNDFPNSVQSKQSNNSEEGVIYPIKDKLLKVLNKLGVVTNGLKIVLLDGYACIGFESVQLPNLEYTMDIYVNPDKDDFGVYDSQCFGWDLYHNNQMDYEAHFDAGFVNWQKDFESYNYKQAFKKLTQPFKPVDLNGNVSKTMSKIDLKDVGKKLGAVLNYFNIAVPASVDCIDGYDCVGFEKVSLGADFTCDIYTNPEYVNGSLVVTNFGWDLNYKGKFLDDSHFDSTLENWEKAIDNYKYLWVFSNFNSAIITPVRRVPVGKSIVGRPNNYNDVLVRTKNLIQPVLRYLHLRDDLPIVKVANYESIGCSGIEIGNTNYVLDIYVNPDYYNKSNFGLDKFGISLIEKSSHIVVDGYFYMGFFAKADWKTTIQYWKGFNML